MKLANDSCTTQLLCFATFKHLLWMYINVINGILSVLQQITQAWHFKYEEVRLSVGNEQCGNGEKQIKKS